MSNDPRENLHGSDSEGLADVTADAARTGTERAASTPAHTSDEAPAQRSALSSFEEILSGTTHEADAPATDDGAQDPQETLVSDGPLLPQNEAEATPAALETAATTATAEAVTDTTETTDAPAHAQNTDAVADHPPAPFCVPIFLGVRQFRMQFPSESFGP